MTNKFRVKFFAREQAFQILDQPPFPSDTNLLVDDKFDFSICSCVQPDIDSESVWLRGFDYHYHTRKVHYGDYDKYSIEILAKAFKTICDKYGHKFILLIDSGRIEL